MKDILIGIWSRTLNYSIDLIKGDIRQIKNGHWFYIFFLLIDIFLTFPISTFWIIFEEIRSSVEIWVLRKLIFK